MTIEKDTENLIAQAVKNWPHLKAQQAGEKQSYANTTNAKTTVGLTHWDNPNLLWVYISDAEEGYEGSQNQIGLTRNGQLVYEFQSHCSCNDYEDSTGEGVPITDNEVKSFNFTYRIPKEWEAIIQFNLRKLLRSLTPPPTSTQEPK